MYVDLKGAGAELNSWSYSASTIITPRSHAQQGVKQICFVYLSSVVNTKIARSEDL